MGPTGRLLLEGDARLVSRRLWGNQLQILITAFQAFCFKPIGLVGRLRPSPRLNMVEGAPPDGGLGMHGLEMGGGHTLRFIRVGRGLLIYVRGHLHVLIILSRLDNF